MKKESYADWSTGDLIKEIKKLKMRKKYGVVWDEEHTKEKFEKEAEGKLPVLKEDKSKEIKTDENKPINILIEGDNYHALSVLNYTHEGAIDLIYIDPPYNTGNGGFIYNDRLVDKEDDYRHSKWLSFMSKRLKWAKKLLRPSGTIFISINEEEFAQLKMLCDKLFGEKNYLTTFTVKVRHEDRILKGDKDIHEVVEYLLFYRKSHQYKTVKRVRSNTSISEYVYGIEELTETPKKIQLGSKIVEIFKPVEFRVHKKSPSITKLKKINIRGSIKQGNSSGRFFMRHLVKMNGKRGYLFKVPGIGNDGLGYRYFLMPGSEKKVNGDYFQGIPLDRKETKEIPYPNFLDFEKDFNNVGYEGGVDFRIGKKPINFILKILEMGGAKRDKNAIILDFFAGSGSTGEAVLKLNNTDNGNRKFILCTNNEGEICTKKCYPRITNAINGYADIKKRRIKGLGGNLKYFKTAFVESEPTDKNKKKLVDQSTEMLCLKEDCFDEVKSGQHFKIFKNNDGDYLGIIYDDNGIDSFKKELKKLHKKINVYVFSLDESAREEEFVEVIDFVNLKPIPEVILNVYKRIFK